MLAHFVNGQRRLREANANSPSVDLLSLARLINHGYDYPMSGDVLFPTTRWSVIFNIQSNEEDAREALDELCETYWPPLYSYAVAWGFQDSEAPDIIQGFLARLLKRDDLSTVDPENGRFRSYLSKALKNYMINIRAAERSQKRAKNKTVAIATIAQNDIGSISIAPNSDEVFDQEWAERLIVLAYRRFAEFYSKNGKEHEFELLKRFLPPLDPDVSLTNLAEKLKVNEGAARTAVCRARKRFKRIVRSEVANTLQDPKDLDDELLYLGSVMNWSEENLLILRENNDFLDDLQGSIS